MIQPKKWLYFLTDKTGKSYSLNRGTIFPSGTPDPIKNTPDGWQDKIVSFARNTKYFGVFRSFTVPLKFVTEGKKILRHLLYTFGIEAICNLVILKLDNDTMKHKDFYWGEIDFSKFRDEKDFVTVNVMEGGLNKYLKANENTNYEIPIIASDTRPVFMEGINFSSTIIYAVVGDNTNKDLHTIGCAFAQQEGTSFGVVPGSSPLLDLSGITIPTNDDRWILRNTESVVDFTITGKLKFYLYGASSITFYLERNTGGAITLFTGFLNVGLHEIAINTTFTMQVNEKIFILCNKSTVSNKNLTYVNTELSVAFKTKYQSSTILARPLPAVFPELVSKITDNQYAANSSLGNQYVVTSGDALRGLSGAVLKTNLGDYFKAAYTIFNKGLGIENNELIIRPIEYFYEDTEVVDLGEIADLKVEVADDLMFNTIKVGYQDQKYDNVNGKDEFNTTHLYTTPIKRVTKEMDLLSPYRADCYGIELTRANLIGKRTTDGGSDNDIFIIEVEEYQYGVIDAEFTFNTSPYGFSLTAQHDFSPGTKISITGTTLNDKTFTVLTSINNGTETVVTTIESTVAEVTGANGTLHRYRPVATYDSISGVINADTVFNVGLSPKRNLLRHGNQLHSIYDKLDGQKLTFQTTDKNAGLVASIGGVNVIENEDVKISKLPAKMFLPYYLNFDAQVPVNLVQLMKNARGYFSFSWYGVKYKGFPIEVSIKPGNNDVQDFKLLSHPANDLKQLINV